MKKYIFSLVSSFLTFFIMLSPLNAQRVIKYITFYPVPYGSHQNLTVEKEFMINMGNDIKSEIIGDFSVAKESKALGFVDIVAGAGPAKTSGLIRSGNSDMGALGSAYLSGSTSILSGPTNINSVFISGGTTVGSGTSLGGRALSNLFVGCSNNPSWVSLRVKGSEDCKKYLVCSGSGDTGCQQPPPVICKSNFCQVNRDCLVKGILSRPCAGNVAHAVSGTQTRTAKCSNGYGWVYSDWSGTCTCESDYSFDAASNTCYEDAKYYWTWESTFGYSQCDGSSNCEQSSVPCCNSTDLNNHYRSKCSSWQEGESGGYCLTQGMSGTCYVLYCRRESGTGERPSIHD